MHGPLPIARRISVAIVCSLCVSACNDGAGSTTTDAPTSDAAAEVGAPDAPVATSDVAPDAVSEAGIDDIPSGELPTTIELPGGGDGIGFDDMQTDPMTGAVLVPAGATGSVFRIDPRTRALTRYEGFAAGTATTGHSAGPTSLDVGPGVLFVTDRTSRTLDVFDLATNRIVAQTRLGSTPDYVRYVPSLNELWVTEPSMGRVEVLDLAPFVTSRMPPTFKLSIAAAGGPESLAIDRTRGLAYTHLWTGARTLAIDLATHAVRSNWASGCRNGETQGLVIDEARGQLFVGCANGLVVALDLAHDGAVLGRAMASPGVDIIAYNLRGHHLYVPSEGGDLTVIGVAPTGALSVFGTVEAPAGAHCVASDLQHTAYVCSPSDGRVVAIDDPYPAS